MTNQKLMNDFLKNLEGVSDTTNKEYVPKLNQMTNQIQYGTVMDDNVLPPIYFIQHNH